MAKKNPNEKILERLKGGNSAFQVFNTANGLTLQVVVKDGRINPASDMKLGSKDLSVADVLQAAAILKLFDGAGCVCTLHGAFDPKEDFMGCRQCRSDFQNAVQSEIARGHVRDNAESA